MSLVSQIRERLRALVFRARDDREMEEELRFHLEMEAEANAQHGAPAADADRRARVAFGGVARYSEEVREARGLGFLETLTGDAWHALRRLGREPKFTVTALLCLALGIGLNATVFSVVYAVLMRPVPFPEPHQIAAIARTRPQRGVDRGNVPAADFFDFRDRSRSFRGMAGYYTSSFTLALADGAEYLDGVVATPELFRVLDVAPALGRDFTPDEATPGHDGVVMLSDALWRRRFNADPRIVGRVLQLNGKPRTVVGVMPPTFEFPYLEQLWVPAAFASRNVSRGSRYLNVVARLNPGVSMSAANAELAGIARQLALAYPESNADWGARAFPLRELLIQSKQLRGPFSLLVGAVAFVLLIVCANLAGLQVTRAVARRREIAVRMALGASRSRIVRQLLTESVLLAVIGAVLALVVAIGALQLVTAAVPKALPQWVRFSLDPVVLAITGVVAGGVGILFGLAPALIATRGDVQHTLRDAGRGSTGGLQGTRVRAMLVVAEIALSLVLLIGASLTIQSFVRLQRSRLGFDPNGVMTASVAMSGARFDSLGRRAAFYSELLDRAAALPGVVAAGAAAELPLGGYHSQTILTIEGRDVAKKDLPLVDLNRLSGEYFRAMGIGLLTGRAFSRAEWTDSAARAAVINEAMAKRFWQSETPLGRRIRLGGDSTAAWLTVVGVVRDVTQHELGEVAGPAVFVTGPQRGNAVLVVRAADGDATMLATPLRRLVAMIEPSVPLYDVRTMQRVIADSESTWLPRFYGGMFGAFAATAVLLAVVGLYGVVAYAVSQRAREIGVRMALGASPSAATRLIVSRGARLTTIGVAIGLLGAAGVSRLLGGILYGVRPTDILTFVAASLALGAAALGASFLPARRASRVDPAIVLREE